MFNKFEQMVFKFVRVFFLFFSFIAFISLVFSGIALTINLPKLFKDENNISIKITHQDVEKQIQSKKLVKYDYQITNKNYNTKTNKNKQEDQNIVEQDQLQKYTDMIIKELDNKFQNEVGYWYQKKQIENAIEKSLSKISKRDLENFVKEMLASIKKAPKEEVFDYIKEHFDLYFQKQSQEINRILSEKQSAQKKLLVNLSIIGSSIILLISAGIILILAAIERNTRQIPKSDS